MEKQSGRKRPESCRRLLIFIFILQISFSLYAAGPKNPYAGLKLTAEQDKKHFVYNDVEFHIALPDTKSSTVDIRWPSLSSDVNFRYSEKKDLYDEEGNRYCDVVIVVNFMKKGRYQFASALFNVNGRYYRIPFEAVNVLENPLTLPSEVTLEISEKVTGKNVFAFSTNSELPITGSRQKTISVENGKVYVLKLYTKNVIHISSFSWDIPRDSIFTLKNDWQHEVEQINNRGKESKKAIEGYKYDEILNLGKNEYFAEFEWTVLKDGSADFPKLKTNVTAFNGVKTDFMLSDFTVVSKKSTAVKKEADNLNDYFEDAFTSEPVENKSVMNIRLTVDEGLTLAKHYENELKMNKDRLKLLRKSKLGVNLDCTLYSIPEESASKIYEIKSGLLIKILEQTDEWIYIQAVDNSEKTGWCKKDSVVMLNQKR